MAVSTNLLSANVSDIEADASGWTAGTSTTLAQSTTKAYTGTKSLAMTRTTSAGAASATTTARVAVTAGTVYTAYAYLALVVAAAGRTATVRIDWWAASTGGTAISSSTSPTATLASSTAFQPAASPIVIGTAPAGAFFASLTITVSGMSTSEVVCADAIALGPPALLTGNLLPYAAQSVEQDATSWGAWFGVTLTRSSTSTVEGWWSLQATSTVTGNMDVGGPTVTITAGTMYLGYMWVRPTVTGSVTAELRWQDASSVAIGTPVTLSWPGVSGGAWTRVAVVGTAPVGAAKAILVMHPQSTASGQTWLLDQAFIGAVTNEAGNLLDYARYSAELQSTGWTATGGTLAQSLAQSTEQLASFALTCTGTVDAVVSLATPVAVTAGQAYTVRPYVRPPAGGGSYVVRMAWLNAGGSTIRQTSATWTATAGTWTSSATVDLAPVGAVSLRPSIVRSGSTAGDVWYLDKILITAGGLAAVATPITAAYGASISIQGLTTGGRTRWGLWRVAPDGAQTPVRGYLGDLTAETVTGDVTIVEDYEAPLGVPVAYYVKGWTAPAGTDWVAFTTDQITLAGPNELSVVLKDPSIPSRNLALTVTTPPSWKRSARQGVHSIRGRARPVILTDVRAARTGTLVLSTQTEAERNAVWWLLESGHTLLAQWPPGWSEPDAYFQVGDADEGRPSEYAPQTDREWTLALTEVDRPIGGLVGSAGRTWQTVKDAYATWADVLSHYSTWLGVLTGVEGT
ncbi:hypothetical protein [Streptomyces sp. CB03911]|uniref:hypothetical protein n=1 Tax=Streptomyces sp. CB03911 TaxID=1804758 RepID=UPI00093FDB56|nr:hypothetical protein [Streptomyces sp. CB03911]OKI19308.1 hypothetical protein A6A07_07345 [Streptomyces sp. CB03911]